MPLASPLLVADSAAGAPGERALFVAVAPLDGEPATRGGLRKFVLRADGSVVDRAGAPALDTATGSIRSAALSAWRLPADRGPLYTDVARGPLATAENAVTVLNPALGARLLGVSARGAEERLERIRTGLTASGRIRSLAYAAPAQPGTDAAVVFTATDDGYLHAIDAQTGAELWSFVPLERLSRADRRRADSPPRVSAAEEGGSLEVYRLAGGGPPTEGEGASARSFLLFGAAGAEASYFAFDVTRPAAPTLLWRDGAAELPFLGAIRAATAVARVRIAGAVQNAAHLVAIVSGGDESTTTDRPVVGARRGNRLYFIDALSGALLWRAGPSAPAADVDAGANLRLARLDRPIASRVGVLDLDGDGYADRLYAADTGARLWRFDIHNGATVDALVSGGVWASLGTADSPGPSRDSRRFYHTPDAAFVRDAGVTFVQLSVGSGGAGGAVQDYFYGLRDYDLGPLPAAVYGTGGWNASRVLTDATPLVNASADAAPSVPPRARGWRVALRTGEAVSAESRTFGGAVFFTTETATAVAVPGCDPPPPARALYVLRARDGALPGYRATRFTALPAGQRAASVQFILPLRDPRSAGVSGSGCAARADGCPAATLCYVGLAACGPLPAIAPVRTTWAQLDRPP